jgi:hypothetical protein
LADVCQKKRDPESQHDVCDKEEQDFLERKNPKEQHAGGLTLGKGPGCCCQRDDIHQRKIQPGDQDAPKDQFAIMPENVRAEQELEEDRGQRPEENDGQVCRNLISEEEEVGRDKPDKNQ